MTPGFGKAPPFGKTQPFDISNAPRTKAELLGLNKFGRYKLASDLGLLKQKTDFYHAGPEVQVQLLVDALAEYRAKDPVEDVHAPAAEDGTFHAVPEVAQSGGGNGPCEQATLPSHDLLARLAGKCRDMLVGHAVTKDANKLQVLLRYTERDQADVARRLVNMGVPWEQAFDGLDPVTATAVSADPVVEVPPAIAALPVPEGAVLTRLRLDAIVLDPEFQVRQVDDQVACEYAEHVSELPPSDVMDIDGVAKLLNGFHRYRAHVIARGEYIWVWLRRGTIDDAKLFVAKCDNRVGVRRTNAAKRAAVAMVLATTEGSTWSDREIAEHCGVSHPLVASVKEERRASREGASGNSSSCPQDATTGSHTEAGTGSSSVPPQDENAGPRDSNGGERVADTPPPRRRGELKPVKKAAGGAPPGSAPAVREAPAPDQEGDDEADDDLDAGALSVGESDVPTLSDVLDDIEAMVEACSGDQDKIRTLDLVGEWVAVQRDILLEAIEHRAGVDRGRPRSARGR